MTYRQYSDVLLAVLYAARLCYVSLLLLLAALTSMQHVLARCCLISTSFDCFSPCTVLHCIGQMLLGVHMQVRQAFSERRKMVRNTLQSLYEPAEVAAALTAADIADNVRPQQLTLAQYAHLWHKLRAA